MKSKEQFRREVEDLVDNLFRGVMGLTSTEHFRDLIGDGTDDDNKMYWDQGMDEIYEGLSQ